MSHHKTTQAQKVFLKSYLEEIMDIGEARKLTKDQFVKVATGMDFDDGFISEPSVRRTAKTLFSAGLLSELEIHNGHIYLVFSDAGGSELFDLAAAE